MALTSRLAIIVGGTGGLGSAVGKLLRDQGAQLALLYAPFEAARVDQILEEVYGIKGNEGDIRAYECDITSFDSVSAAFREIELSKAASVAFPSILINAADYVDLSLIEDTPFEEIIKHLHINLLGPYLASQAFAKLYFRAKEEFGSTAPGGKIISIASTAAHIGYQEHGAYCASKAGLLGLTKCMAIEWGPKGIVSNTVSPGPVLTELGKKAWSDRSKRDHYLSQVATGRFSEPDEIAGTIAFLCQDLASNINGTDILVDGGYVAR